jgi:gamma-glutamyl phosphate reductase
MKFLNLLPLTLILLACSANIDKQPTTDPKVKEAKFFLQKLEASNIEKSDKSFQNHLENYRQKFLELKELDLNKEQTKKLSKELIDELAAIESFIIRNYQI